MRLDELIGIRDPLSKIRDYDDITKWMESKGYHLLGEGFYSSVFMDKNPNFVIKIAEDPSYLEYIQFCQKNSSNKHLPKVSKFFSLPDNWHNFKVFKIEKLTPLPEKYDFGNFVFDYISSHLELSYLKLRQRFTNPNLTVSYRFGMNFQDTKLGDKSPMVLEFFDNYFTADAYDIFRKISRLFDGDLDLNVTNMMVRGNTLVFTDPAG